MPLFLTHLDDLELSTLQVLSRSSKVLVLPCATADDATGFS